MNYKDGFYLTGERGNNAFAYEQRAARLADCLEPRLYVPAVMAGGLDDVQLGDEVIFEDVDEHGELKSCKGLRNFVRMEFLGVPAVIFDNHNHAFYFWWEAAQQGLVKPGATLVHVDQHKDMREPAEAFGLSFGGANSDDALEKVFRYTNEVLNVGNYIPPAIEAGLIGEVQFVTSEAALTKFGNLQNPSRDGNSICKILNLDLDFFAPEMDYIDFEKARAFIQAAAKDADFITIAISPFFIDQGLAIEVLKRLSR